VTAALAGFPQGVMISPPPKPSGAPSRLRPLSVFKVDVSNAPYGLAETARSSSQSMSLMTEVEGGRRRPHRSVQAQVVECTKLGLAAAQGRGARKAGRRAIDEAMLTSALMLVNASVQPTQAARQFRLGRSTSPRNSPRSVPERPVGGSDRQRRWC